MAPEAASQVDELSVEERRALLDALLRDPGIRTRVCPTSSAQWRLWFLDRMGVGAAYNLSNVFRIVGALDADALERSVNAIVARHGTLRTTFASMAGVPRQIIAPALRIPLVRRDLAELPVEQRETVAREVVADEAQWPFDLTKGPLLRALLIRLGAREHVLAVTSHHIVSDAWSQGIFRRELAEHYRAFRAGETPRVAPLPMQYADFSVEQQALIDSGGLGRQRAFWKARLGDGVPVLELPTDHPRPAVQTFAGATVGFRFAVEQAKAIETFARRYEVTPAMFLLAGFQMLLSRYTGQDDIAVGSPVANRNRSEIEDLIGFFVNMLVLRTDLSGDPTFAEVLSRVKQVALSAYENQEFPFDRLVDELGPERDLSRSPLVQTAFVVQNVGLEALRLADLDVEPYGQGRPTTRFDLEVYISTGPGSLSGWVCYNTDLFEGATIERMITDYQRLLAAAMADPDTPIAALSLLSEAERHQVLVAWNDTEAAYPDDTCVHQLFEAQVERTPDAVAVVFEDEALTYAQLNQRANQVAHTLRGMGVDREDLVGLCVERSLEMIVGLLGILKAGGAYVPLDPTYPQERLAFMLADSGVSVLLTQAALVDALPPFDGQRLCLDRDATTLAEAATHDPAPRTGPDHLAYVIYTSGSTGRPKGVLLAHRGLVSLSEQQTRSFGIGSASRMLQFSSLSFDASTFEIVMALTKGATLVLGDRKSLLPGADLLRLLHAQRVSILTLPPTALAALPLEELPELKTITVAGEVCSSDLVRRWARTTILQSVRPDGGNDLVDGGGIALGQGAHIGHPIGNVQIYVFDEQGRLVPVGVPGELHIGGLGVARGYLNRPTLTAERFTPDPFGAMPGARLYRTGDTVRWRPDGTIEFLCRRDHQVKIRGYRIELAEVEHILTSAPGVSDAIVICREGQNADKCLVGYIVPERAGELDHDDVGAWLRERLPEYMLPTFLVGLEALPLTPNGKVDRQALPEPDRRGQAGAIVAPRSGMEEVLCSIWADVLGLDRVGVHDDFFALGGHSLLATQLISRIRNTLEIEVPLRDLFEHRTVAELSESMHARGVRPTIPPLVPCDRDDDLPLSFAQQRLWFLDQMDVGAAYNMPMALRLRGRLDVACLEQTLREVVHRHESLRTSFPMGDERPVQRIAKTLAFELARIDLRDLDPDDQETEVFRLSSEEAGRPFDLASGPLLRGTLLSLGDAECVLLLTLHHIVSDGWSMGVLFRELTTLYEAFSQGEASPLAELEIQYGDFAQWQRSWLAGAALDEQLSYWRAQLAELRTLDLPTDRRRPAEQTFAGAAHGFEIPSESCAALHRLCREQGVTPAMALLAGWQVLLSRYSGQDDIAVGSPIANRTHEALEPLIGFFVNTLVMRTDLSGDPSVEELLRRVQAVSLSAYEHQDVPFEQIVEDLNPPRDLSRHPLVQVMFAMQNAPRAGLRLGDLEIEGLGQETTRTRLDLEFHCFAGGDRVVGRLIYNTDLFDAATIERMADHLIRVLERMAADPSRRVSELLLLSEAERHQVLVAWNDTEAAYPDDTCVHQLFEAQVERTPDAVAVVFEDEALTYAQLNQRANQVAHTLRGMGVDREDLVGLCVERSLEMIVGLLGILKAGGAYVPLDPTYPQERLAFMLADSGVSVLLTQAALVDALPPFDGQRLCLDRDATTLAEAATHDPAPRTGPDHLAYVIYTSGSTGRPKGIQVPHRGVINFLMSMGREPGLRPSDRLLSVTTISFDIAVLEFFLPLTVGASVEIVSRSTSADGTRLRDRLAHRDITVMQATPAMWQMLVDAGWEGGRGLRMLCGGEALPWGLARRLLECERELWNLYGPTETTIWSTVDAVAGNEDSVSIGRPIANTTVYVLDDALTPAPVGVSGELYIGGAGVTRGYLARPGLTAERFVPDPFSAMPGARLYRTGDAVRWTKNGSLEFLGRVDHQVKLRGYRIELGEIETVLEQHPSVERSVAMVRTDRPEDRRLAAYIVPRNGASLDTSAVQAFLKERLPRYMVPSALSSLESLPLTPNGKLDRNALPAPADVRVGRALVVPATPMEQLLADLWKELIGLEPVDVHDNFFDVGGHSLLAARVDARMHERTGVRIRLVDFMQNTLGQLARIYETELRNAEQAKATAPNDRHLWRRLVSKLTGIMSPDRDG